MKAFNTLSKKELENLRKHGSVVNKSLNFKITSKEFNDAKKIFVLVCQILVIILILIGCGKQLNNEKKNVNETKTIYVDDNKDVSYEEMTFGSYNGQSYKWYILDRADGKILLLAKSLIARNPLDITRNKEVDSSWDNCVLREWPNKNCLNDIFNENERKLILETVNENSNDTVTSDRIFLLSEEEIKKYFNAKQLQEYFGSSMNNVQNWWWLRTFCNDHNYAKYVNSYGSVEDNEVNHNIGIRPAMWILQN